MSSMSSNGLIRLFVAEIANEHDEETGQSRDGASSPGGECPATLSSTLDSVGQGLEIDGEDMNALVAEIMLLIAIHGPDKEVAYFLSDE